MLENLFGNPVIEKVLFYILVHDKCYASQLKKTFGMPLYSFQRALLRLERGGIIVNFKIGKTVVYQFNPTYAFLKELKAFLKKAYEALPEAFRGKYYEPKVRTRPKRKSC